MLGGDKVGAWEGREGRGEEWEVEGRGWRCRELVGAVGVGYVLRWVELLTIGEWHKVREGVLIPRGGMVTGNKKGTGQEQRNR